jgi:hypothetical protein
MNHHWAALAVLGDKARFHGALRERQESWLRQCLKRNQVSTYLKSFGVDALTSPEEFRQQLPLTNYDNLSPFIEHIEQGEENALFEGKAIAFERTGGSSGGNKLIPYSVHSLADFRTAILPWLSDAINGHDISSGCAYWSISPATRPADTTSGGIPIGLPDGAYLGDDALHSFVELSAAPPWIGSLHSTAEWSIATLYSLLCRHDLALVSVWSPTFFLMLLDTLEREYAKLSDLLRQGGIVAGHDLPADEPALERLNAYMNSLDTRVLWPALKLVSCWADASSRPFFNELRHRLPQAKFQGKGLLATEGVTTIPDKHGQPVLAADSGFFEFLDAHDTTYFSWELQAGKQYEVVMTTSGGLYRYRTGDCVQCEGYSGELPVLRFQGRQGLASDIVGEKLTEQFVDKCLEDIPGFRMLIPQIQNKPKYVLIMDQRTQIDHSSLGNTVEEHLSKNPQYAYARNMGQLDSLAVLFVRSPLESFVQRMTRNGARLGDIKVPALRPETDWLDTFLEYAQ